MGCYLFSNYHFRMGVTVMGFAEHFGHHVQRSRCINEQSTAGLNRVSKICQTRKGNRRHYTHLGLGNSTIGIFTSFDLRSCAIQSRSRLLSDGKIVKMVINCYSSQAHYDLEGSKHKKNLGHL